MCFETAIISLNGVNQLIFLMVKCGILFEARTELLIIIIIIIIIIVIINCNWVSTRWQCSIYKYKKHKHYIRRRRKKQ
jgi:hypothetical protein